MGCFLLYVNICGRKKICRAQMPVPTIAGSSPAGCTGSLIRRPWVRAPQGAPYARMAEGGIRARLRTWCPSWACEFESHFVHQPRITTALVSPQKGGRFATQRGAPMQGGRPVMQRLHKLPQAGPTPAPATIHGVSSSVGRAPICGAGCRRFKSALTPHMGS